MSLRAALLVYLTAFAGCISPSVVDPADRAPRSAIDQLEWHAAESSDLAGTYVSGEVTGPLAAVLLRVIYLFQADGSYTGAALIDAAPPYFEVISGTWRLDGEALILDDAPPAELRVASDGSLRITGAEGTVVLRREAAL